MADGSADDSWTAAHALVLRHGWNATAYQLLNPGMRHWFSAAGDAVVGYVDFARTRVVAGAPVCSSERLPAVAHELEASTNADGLRVLYFGAGERLERLYAGSTHHQLVQLGAQPVWDPRLWASVVRGKASLRAQLNRARNKHVVVEEWPIARARESQALRDVLRTWLATRGLPALGFMVTTDLLQRGDDRRVFVATRNMDTVVGFLVATPIPARSGWLVEEWPRVPAAANGTTHLMVDAAMRAFSEQGSSYATLGLAPLSSRGAGNVGPPPLWLRAALRWVRAHGRRFYNFAGLESFKASLQPAEWEPVFAVAQGKHFTPLMLRAVAGAFSGGTPELLVARALVTAARQEAHRLRAPARRDQAHAGA
jgi:phosphatidylglycerol lysyltransferase